jgi:hypothetical protein
MQKFFFLRALFLFVFFNVASNLQRDSIGTRNNQNRSLLSVVGEESHLNA